MCDDGLDRSNGGRKEGYLMVFHDSGQYFLNFFKRRRVSSVGLCLGISNSNLVGLGVTEDGSLLARV